MSPSSILQSLRRRLLQPLRWLAGKLRGANQRVLVDEPLPAGFDNLDAGQEFSIAWFRWLYAELGDGTKCYRPADAQDYGGGSLKSCLCCQPAIRLHLLPNEESEFTEEINDTDFKLVDHPRFKNRKTIVCSKLGMCDGRKPSVCRTHPVYFVDGLMLFEEALCRLKATSYLALHKESVERIRSVVYRYQLQDVALGYGRNFRTKDGLVYREFER